ncbi:MAG: hypothetical protein BGO47_03705 [Microbacterium sp. 67-17]|nr:MAG: hypothetical protein BGO47_03705 [Microbacterium sp. 67-17]
MSVRFRSPICVLSVAILCFSATGLTACSGSGPTAPEASLVATTDVATAEGGSEPTASPEPMIEAASDPESSDLCSLVSHDEVVALLGAATFVSQNSFGSLTDSFGGQCAWADNTTGDTAGGATFLELIVWDPAGTNPPPPDAPRAGSEGIVATSTGAYFASADKVFWLRVSGDHATDQALVSATQALAESVAARI